LWRPQRCPSGMTTPAFFAAGRKWSAQSTDAQIGTLPLPFIDGNTKSVGLACGVCLCHSRRYSVSSLTWELNRAANIGDETDNAFKRHDEMCAARPLSDHDVERIVEGRRLADSMNEEPEE